MHEIKPKALKAPLAAATRFMHVWSLISRQSTVKTKQTQLGWYGDHTAVSTHISSFSAASIWRVPYIVLQPINQVAWNQKSVTGQIIAWFSFWELACQGTLTWDHDANFYCLSEAVAYGSSFTQLAHNWEIRTQLRGPNTQLTTHNLEVLVLGCGLYMLIKC